MHLNCYVAVRVLPSTGRMEIVRPPCILKDFIGHYNSPKTLNFVPAVNEIIFDTFIIKKIQYAKGFAKVAFCDPLQILLTNSHTPQNGVDRWNVYLVVPTGKLRTRKNGLVFQMHPEVRNHEHISLPHSSLEHPL